MTKTVTSPYDVAEHLKTPEEMTAYLEACLEEAGGDVAFIAKALGDIARAIKPKGRGLHPTYWFGVQAKQRVRCDDRRPLSHGDFLVRRLPSA